MLAALTLAVLLTSPVAQEATFERKVGDQTVKVAWPTPEPIPSFWPRLEKNGWSVAARPDGTIAGPFMIDGKWADVRKVLDSTADDPEAVTWRVKVFVMGASDVLDTQPYLRRRFLGMLKPDLDRLNQSLALFAQAVEAKSRKRLKVHIDLEVDRETAYFTLAPNEPNPWVSAHKEYLAPRVNGHNFESDDRIFRGPYDSVFLVDGGPYEAAARFSLYGMPVSTLSYFHQGGSANPGTFAETMVHEWVTHVGSLVNSGAPPSAEGLAYPVEADLGWTSLHKMNWATKSAPLPIDGAQPAYARQKDESLTGSPLPFRSLRMGDENPRLDALYIAGESFGVNPVDAAKLIFGPTRLVEILSVSFRESIQVQSMQPVGNPSSGLSAIKWAGTLPDTEAELFAFPASSGQVPGIAVVNLANGRPYGNATWQKADDTSEPAAMKLDFSGGSTMGGVRLWGDEGGSVAWDIEAYPTATLRFRATSSEPVDIVVRWWGIGGVGRYRLFEKRTWPLVAERDYTPKLESTFSNDWQQVVIPVKLRGSNARPKSISIESTSSAGYLGSQGQKIDFVIASLLPSSTEPTKEIEPVFQENDLRPDAADPMSRLNWLKSVQSADALPQVLTLIADPDETVRLNAIDVFTRFEFAAAEKPLADALRTFNMRQVELALKALAHQNTESAWAVVQRALDIGPGDTTRMMAARELGKRGTRGNSGSFAVLFNSRSWRAREAAVLALGQLKTREASLMQIVFLQEVDPAVRLAVTRTADTSLDQVCRRLLWSCVNDTSDAVRAASYIRLLSGPIEAYRAEGYKGVRDESPFVRMEVLAYLAQNGNEAHRPALRIAVVDADPRVRAAALRGFVALPGAVTIEEIGAAATDAHPDVKAAWLELKKAKGLPDPSNPS